MKSYQHILLAIDFSTHSEEVSSQASDIAKRYQAKLSVCHIIEDIAITDLAYEPMISFDMEIKQAMMEAGKRQLSELSEKLDIPTDNQWLEFGNPVHDIIRLAEEQQIDLIVIGSHGRHGIRRILGSTANGVLHHATCDVLAVRLTE